MKNKLDILLENTVTEKKLAGISVLVQRNGEVLYEKQFGYADIANNIAVDDNTIFRFMSLTKVVTSIAIAKLIEEGKLTMDDRLDRFYPGFARAKVVKDPAFRNVRNPQPAIERMQQLEKSTLTFADMDLVELERPVTIRDLLSHSSGLGTGIVGNMILPSLYDDEDTLQVRMHKFETLQMDNQPGAYAFYSPIVAFDLLGGIVELISGQDLQTYLCKNILDPLGMQDTRFHLDEEQKARLCRLYRLDDGDKLTDVTDTSEDTQVFAPHNYQCGSGGLYSTVRDYDRIAQMLAGNGTTPDGVTILKPESVTLMHTQAQPHKLAPVPGAEWGMGVMIWMEPSLMNRLVPVGTYGWSGGYGTHMFIDPATGLHATVGINRSNIEGLGCFSPINIAIEGAIFSLWG